MTEETITRGADLTEEDIAMLADDAIEVRNWAFKMGLARPQMVEEVRQAFRVRLGRRERSS